MTRGFRVAEKVSLSEVGGAGEKGGQLEGKLCTDMPSLLRTDPFLPEGPAFLGFLPRSFSPRLESLATFPAFPSPPLAPRILFFGEGRHAISLPPPLLSSLPLPLC